MNLARRLREDLCRTAAATDPDAPTLCPPWSVADLLRHLAKRDAQRVSEGELDYPALVEKVRTGPAPWWPARFAPVDDLINPAEMLVHREDIRRAQPGWEPAVIEPDALAAAWRSARLMGRIGYRSVPVGVVLIAPGFGRAAVRRPRPGHGTVVLTGDPMELLLHAFGRRAVALVTIEGAPADLAAFAAAD